MTDLAWMQVTDQFEALHEIDNKLEALERKGQGLSPRAQMLRRRRQWAQEELRALSGVIEYERCTA